MSSGGSGDATPARLARRREKRYDGLKYLCPSLPAQARLSHSICWDPFQELIKGMSTFCWSSTCSAGTPKDTPDQLTRRRHKVAQPSWYTTTSRDGVALTLSLGQRSRVRVHGLRRNLPRAWGREEILH